ncbi:MAG TPA: isoleucine--tRNA ligase, partial [Thermoanaerobaculia bacterium]|nr:isoleucine--tRNA ligase [Thermoanaerobaculia bacterium]
FTDQTALAEAELEYTERTDPAIYVGFEFRDGDEVSRRFGRADAGVRAAPRAVIWTTTPWTIPSNLAIAVHPDELYDLVSNGADAPAFVVARKLRDSVAAKIGATWTVAGSVAGRDLVGLRYAHPHPPEMRGEITPDEEERSFRVVEADYVTMDAGTGLVHTAPGHGEDDFQTGAREGLPVLSPVDAAGRFTTAAKYRGRKVLEANAEIVADLSEAGALLHAETAFRHEYPHCWRCKNPVIFRATIQWFVRLDDPGTDVRAAALEAIGRVRWKPPWGEPRISGMVENRREWVISRQRRWGSPITLLYAVRGDEREVYPWRDDPAEQETFFAHVVEIFRREGGDAWYARPVADFLPPDADRRGFDEFQKETDILDVWFDSGVSHLAVLRSGEWPELAPADPGPPADLYVEGHDQYRGWFQSSLLTSVALFGEAPYKGVITHGFALDVEARKMSKSLGNAVEPRAILGKYGADILRLWVTSLDYTDDDPISDEILARCAEAYRKVRNTARYLISNLYDFDPASHSVAPADLLPLDRWAVREAQRLAARVLDAYRDYEFHVVYHALVNFSATTLSAFYLDVLKDRLYASPADSAERRSAQTALHRIARSLATLAAPILPFTAEEIWGALPGAKEQSVHLSRFDGLDDFPQDPLPDSAWDRLMKLREEASALLEAARREKVIGSSLEGAIALSAHADLEADRRVTGTAGPGLADLLIVSETIAAPAGSNGSGWTESRAYPGLVLKFEKARGRRCDRCWKVTPEAEEGGLCERCRRALALAAAPIA